MGSFKKHTLIVCLCLSLCTQSLLAATHDIDTLNDSSLTKEERFNTLLKPSASLKDIPEVPLNMQAISFVQEFTRKQGKEMEKMKTWAKPYFDMYDMILTQYGIPKEMKYLSVIESHLQSNLVSWAGAVGPWQLMDYEAKRFGLKTGKFHDERMDYYQSTHVACKLMKELHEEFGNWLLVIAAYNGGAGRVRQAIEKSGSHNFWDLQYYLKDETRTHVKKFIATHYFFEGNGGITTMTDDEINNYLANQKSTNTLSDEVLATTSTKEISGRYNSVIIANYLVMSISEFNKLNPGFDKELSEGNKYLLRLPNLQMKIFEARKSEILMLSVKSLLEGR